MRDPYGTQHVEKGLHAPPCLGGPHGRQVCQEGKEHVAVEVGQRHSSHEDQRSLPTGEERCLLCLARLSRPGPWPVQLSRPRLLLSRAAKPCAKPCGAGAVPRWPVHSATTRRRAQRIPGFRTAAPAIANSRGCWVAPPAAALAVSASLALALAPSQLGHGKARLAVMPVAPTLPVTNGGAKLGNPARAPTATSQDTRYGTARCMRVLWVCRRGPGLACS